MFKGYLFNQLSHLKGDIEQRQQRPCCASLYKLTKSDIVGLKAFNLSRGLTLFPHHERNDGKLGSQVGRVLCRK